MKHDKHGTLALTITETILFAFFCFSTKKINQFFQVEHESLKRTLSVLLTELSFLAFNLMVYLPGLVSSNELRARLNDGYMIIQLSTVLAGIHAFHRLCREALTVYPQLQFNRMNLIYVLEALMIAVSILCHALTAIVDSVLPINISFLLLATECFVFGLTAVFRLRKTNGVSDSMPLKLRSSGHSQVKLSNVKGFIRGIIVMAVFLCVIALLEVTLIMQCLSDGIWWDFDALFDEINISFILIMSSIYLTIWVSTEPISQRSRRRKSATPSTRHSAMLPLERNMPSSNHFRAQSVPNMRDNNEPFVAQGAVSGDEAKTVNFMPKVSVMIGGDHFVLHS